WLTDILDGFIARKYNLQTRFGAFFDQFVDKIFITFGLIALTDLGFIPIWLTLPMLFRDYLVTGIRSLMNSEGKILKSEMSGKLKFGLQMLTILTATLLSALSLTNPDIKKWMYTVILWVMIIATAEAYYALIEFFWKNRKILGKVFSKA
ncbi:CDP-alcohol phosphatidyltransferase family protein, partial [Candidatus Woesearchaeota archaeon]|nr:CDP-alcohol phosphatidyltransferase family protein [Candidatus Woesearchaeota archaeon]